MEKLENKIKIYKFKTLEGRLVHRKLKVGPFVQVKPKRVRKKEDNKLKKDKNISTVVRLLSTCYY